MNAVVSQTDDAQSNESQAERLGTCDLGSGAKPAPPGPDVGDRLANLGRLLGGHTWRDSREWAHALDQLCRLSEDELERVIDASPGSGAT